MRLPLIQINGKCEVPFYFVCICQKCYIISVKYFYDNFMLIYVKNHKNYCEKNNLINVHFMIILC